MFALFVGCMILLALMGLAFALPNPKTNENGTEIGLIPNLLRIGIFTDGTWTRVGTKDMAKSYINHYRKAA